MTSVVSELNSGKKGVEAIESAARVHYDMASIHPFNDGNGRLARLLMNLRLMRAGSISLSCARKSAGVITTRLKREIEGI